MPCPEGFAPGYWLFVRALVLRLASGYVPGVWCCARTRALHRVSDCFWPAIVSHRRFQTLGGRHSSAQALVKKYRRQKRRRYRLFFHRNGFLCTFGNFFRGNSVGFQHQRCFAAAAKLVGNAVTDDRNRIYTGQVLAHSCAQTA